jgi:hypothetical protein
MTIYQFRHRPSAAVLVLLMLASGRPSAQSVALLDAEPRPGEAREERSQGAANQVLPQSRRRLTRDEWSALAGQSLHFSVKTRWPPRVVKGMVVGIASDDVLIRTDKAIESFPMAKATVSSTLPGDFAVLLGQRVEITIGRSPRSVVGRVIGVTPSDVVIDTGDEQRSFPVANAFIVSRNPERRRKHEILAVIGVMVTTYAYFAIKCGQGDCE